jgi:hypothetical protein
MRLFFTPHDVVEGVLLVVVLVPIAFYGARDAWRKSRCRHDQGINETQACDAICRRCGKNLGFIGSWRNRHEGEL